MGNRSKRHEYGWHSADRAYRDHERNRRAKKQLQQLKASKSEAALRKMATNRRKGRT